MGSASARLAETAYVDAVLGPETVRGRVLGTRRADCARYGLTRSSISAVTKAIDRLGRTPALGALLRNGVVAGAAKPDPAERTARADLWPGASTVSLRVWLNLSGGAGFCGHVRSPPQRPSAASGTEPNAKKFSEQ